MKNSSNKKTRAIRPNTPNHYPSWSPRFWNGMKLGSYVRMLSENKFKIHPSRYPMTALVGGCTVVNSCMAALQNLFYGHKIKNAEFAGPPIFVIGHWRSGTTLLHEILAQDPRFAYPSTYDCFVPDHFLVSQKTLKPIARMLLPSRRPMDDMPAGIDLPQEDEFALCALGTPTPYSRVAFCNHKPQHVDLLNTENAPPEKLEQLRDSLEKFYGSLSLAYKKPLVLKSPTHTGRIATLAKWFPDAKFVHIARHPYRIFSSTMRLWKSLDQVQSFQKPKYSESWLQRFVFQCYEKMYDGYFSAVDSIPSSQLIELRYEDLMADPLGEIKNIYSQLELPNFGEAQPNVETFLKSRGGYQPNPMHVEDELKLQIDKRWHEYFDRYDYDSDQVTDVQPPTKDRAVSVS